MAFTELVKPIIENAIVQHLEKPATGTVTLRWLWNPEKGLSLSLFLPPPINQVLGKFLGELTIEKEKIYSFIRAALKL